MPQNDFNEYQVAALRAYGGGDFEYIADLPKEEGSSALRDCGDTLLQFIITELSDSEDCDGLSSAIGRMSCAIEDIETVKSALEDLT